MRRLVLASTSRWRGELLARLGLPFEQLDSGVDEAPLQGAGLSAEQLATRLAISKAEALAGRCPDALILGGDQVAALDELQLGKPGSAERAREQLARLQGRTHRLVTAVALHDPRRGTTRHRLDVHHMQMRALSARQIAAYVAADHPIECAGAYRVEALGATLFTAMAGDDWTAIIGLPLLAVTALLAEAGLDPLGPT